METKNWDEKEKIVFLYAAPHSGHKACADAVRRAMEMKFPQVHTAGTDVITKLSPILGRIVATTYHEILKYTPQLWNFLYDNPEIEELTKELREIFHFLNAPKLKTILKEYQPTALVCTHAIPCGVIAEQKKRGNCDLPLIAIVTDFAVHSYWVFPEVDLYIVANEFCKKKLIAKRISENKIQVSGIPVEPSFSQKTEEREARKKFGLELGKPVVLLMGGSYGLGPISEIAQEVFSLHPAVQLVIVAGTNKELFSKLKAEPKLKHAHILGYTRQISALMDASNILITKPGGMTSSEALAKGLPMILMNPLPGQEERNAKFLLKNKVAIQIREMKDLKRVLKQLLMHPQELEQLSEKALHLAKPNAAKDAAETILSLIKKFRNEKLPFKVPSLQKSEQRDFSLVS